MPPVKNFIIILARSFIYFVGVDSLTLTEECVDILRPKEYKCIYGKTYKS